MVGKKTSLGIGFYFLFRETENRDESSNRDLRTLANQNRICGGWDLNPRTPTGLDPQSSAFT